MKIKAFIRKTMGRFMVGAIAFLPFLIIFQILVWLQGFGVDIFLYVADFSGSNWAAALLLIGSFYGVYLIGSSIEKFGKSFALNLLETAIVKIPAVNFVYSAIKKIIAIFAKNEDDEGKSVVLIEYPNDGLWVPAYVLNKEDSVLVLFVPTSPNPTSGYVIIVEDSQVVHTELSISEASQFIISMGSDFVQKEHICKLILDANKARDNKTHKHINMGIQAHKSSIVSLQKAIKKADKSIKKDLKNKANHID
jgi:uncharacterized membrane protein